MLVELYWILSGGRRVTVLSPCHHIAAYVLLFPTSQCPSYSALWGFHSKNSHTQKKNSTHTECSKGSFSMSSWMLVNSSCSTIWWKFYVGAEYVISSNLIQKCFCLWWRIKVGSFLMILVVFWWYWIYFMNWNILKLLLYGNVGPNSVVLNCLSVCFVLGAPWLAVQEEPGCSALAKFLGVFCDMLAWFWF